MRSLKTKYDCEDAKKDIDLFFSIGLNNPAGESAFWQAIRHIAHDKDPQRHKKSCIGCWRYFKRKKKKIQNTF